MFWRDWKTHRIREITISGSCWLQGVGERVGIGRDQSGLDRIIIGQRNTIQSAQFADKFKMATLDRESFWRFVSNPWLSWSLETLVVIMDSDGIRRPPKPASQLSTALFMSPQLDLTPEKKTNKPKQNGQKNISEAPTDNKTEESREIYAWYVYWDEMLFFQREQAMRICYFCGWSILLSRNSIST